jgi:probable addiction module antidote protein
MSINLTKWDVVEHLTTEEDMIGYFNACLAENDSALISAALSDIARARAVSQEANDEN